MTYDAIVAGVGGVGSAALYHLARRGKRVLGLDRFPPGHDRGSSHGDTRVIRLAYYEHPDYVPLLRRAYELWAGLEREAGETLYRETGLLQVGPENGRVVEGVLASAARWGLEVERLAPSEARRRFPAFRFPDGTAAVFERKAGFLRVERCVEAHARAAVRRGAELAIGEELRSWRPDGGGLRVETSKGAYAASSLVLTPGPWAPSDLSTLGVSFEVLRKPMFWFRGGPAYSADRCPVFLYETPDGVFYGIPDSGRGLKAAEHTGGRPVADPAAVDRTLDPSERGRLEAFLRESLPDASLELQEHSVCMYTMTRDQHFVVDRHPGEARVAFAAGLSGHGFKFAPVLGEALADLALEGRTDAPVGFLGLSRPGLRD